MAAIFRPSANLAAALVLSVVTALLVAGVGWWWEWPRVNWPRHVRWYVEQPVPFSHQHHVAGLGIDCRFCHTSVETSSFAGIPPTKTCMNCHSQIWTNAELLEPVRASYRSGQSLQWTRVNQLPDFV